jgi:hypothetical protein
MDGIKMKYDIKPKVEKISRNPAGTPAATTRITSHVLRSLPENPVSIPVTTSTARARPYATTVSRRLSSNHADHSGEANNLMAMAFAFLC